MIRHGISNDSFNLVIFSPLIKNKRKPKDDSNNYRAIALILYYMLYLYYIRVFYRHI